MNKSVLLFFLLVALSRISQAQVPTFAKVFDRLDYDALVEVEQTSDGGYVSIGYTSGYAQSFHNCIRVIRLNALGDTLWTKIINGSGDMSGTSIQQTMDGGYIIGGFNSSSANSAYAAKLDASGNLTWQKGFGTGRGHASFSSIRQNTDGTYIAFGTTKKDTVSCLFLVKLNSLGDTIWTRTYYPKPGKWHYSHTLTQTSDGGYFMMGGVENAVFLEEMYLIKTDALGISQWTKHYSNEYGFSGTQTIDGGYITSGWSYLSRGAFLIKLNSTGDTVWTKKFPGIKANSVIPTTDGGYAFTGAIVSDTINPAVIFLNLLAAKTDASGNMRFMRTYGDTLDDEGFNIRQTTDGSFVIAGATEWNYNPGVAPMLLGGPNKALLLKFNFTAADAVMATPEAILMENAFQLYPNPTSSRTTIKLSDKTLKTGYLCLKITNAIGAVVLLKNISQTETILDVSELKAGFYLVQLQNPENGKVIASKKLLLK